MKLLKLKAAGKLEYLLVFSVIALVFVAVFSLSGCCSSDKQMRTGYKHYVQSVQSEQKQKECRVFIEGNSPALYDNFLEIFQDVGCKPVATATKATIRAKVTREEWRSSCGSNLRARLRVYRGGTNPVIDRSSTKTCIHYTDARGAKRNQLVVILLDLLVRSDEASYKNAIRQVV